MIEEQEAKYRKKKKPGKIVIFYRLKPDMITKFHADDHKLWTDIIDWNIYGYYKKLQDAQKAVKVLNQTSNLFEFKL